MCKVILKKQNLEKARIQKWSSGSYVIIDRINNHFLLSPSAFDFEVYKQTFRLDTDEAFSIPVYYRKIYELQLTDPVETYYPKEME